MTFPDNCLKGIPNQTFLTTDGAIAPHLFHFVHNTQRNDGWHEQSVNWEDESSVMQFTLGQCKNAGELQFRAGVAVLPRSEIDRLNNRPTVRGLLSYERQPLDANPYHGNILIKGNTPKPTMKMIAAGLALGVTDIVSQAE